VFDVFGNDLLRGLLMDLLRGLLMDLLRGLLMDLLRGLGRGGVVPTA
jgi:hypothetical protein